MAAEPVLASQGVPDLFVPWWWPFGNGRALRRFWKVMIALMLLPLAVFALAAVTQLVMARL